MDGELLEKGYEPQAVEARWYDFWMEHGCFAADPHRPGPAFVIVIPPPNVTGVLHMGHALTITIQDALIRWRRMCGDNTLYLPGTDHAGIATQMVVERALKADEGLSRHDLGRGPFIERVWQWKERHGNRINDQLKVLGASLDWDRERFTMDALLTRAVREAFVTLHEQGLIYRDAKLINFCPRCTTALSDLEVRHEENVAGTMWDFAYPLEGGGEIVVSTTRPETMLGDSAVAVHPDDPRYQALIGRRIVHPLLSRTFPVVGDAILVDPAFGTGAVKVTPAHDFNDFEVGRRHGLELIPIFDDRAVTTAVCGAFAGLDRDEARVRVLAALGEQGLLRGERPHTMALGRCQRCATLLEPTLSPQWYVRTKPLAEQALAAVEDGRTTILPESQVKVYKHWLENIQDWCISRQLWWGHRIPAWYCDGCGTCTVTREDPPCCPGCGGPLRQDEDVLDTWFSSGLWPFSTLGWPAQTPELQAYYPTTVMETGYDILFFWVARMMMMGLHLVGDVPFRRVYLHGMIRDSRGEKMSKTRGNVIDPLDLTARYGSDALRFTLASLAVQGRDIKLAEEWIAGYRAFCNKIWNAGRFTLGQLAGWSRPASPPPGLSLADRWILGRLERAIVAVNEGLANFKLNEASLAAYHFFWHELCDWYLEMSKAPLYGDDPVAQQAARYTLCHVLDAGLRLLHPFMPFLTEELWQKLPRLPGDPVSLMLARFPQPGELPLDPEAEETVELAHDVIGAVRAIRSECGVPPAARPALLIHAPAETSRRRLAAMHAQIVTQARLGSLEVAAGGEAPRGSAKAVVGGTVEILLPLLGVVDLEVELARLHKAIGKTEQELAGVRKKLGNADFLGRAPAAVVEKERGREQELGETLSRLHAGLARLQQALG